MKEKNISVSVKVYEERDELKDDDRLLIDRAKAAARSAYAPYSGFHVGAAVLLANGEVITGNNQENAAYPSGLCAERVALFYAKSKYPDVAVRKLAVTAMKDGEVVETPAAPCGACRQVFIEYEEKQNEPLSVLLAGRKTTIEFNSSFDLLPLAFGSNELE